MEFLDEYRDRLYGGFLGKVIGVIHGANTEGWTYEKIKKTLGEITEYPFRFQNFCSDDDINGPVFYMRALKDFEYTEITEESMAHTLLNYVADGHGFFWWGGYGISTEHTAYKNLLNGIKAPISGSACQNGKATAEQIGGQIFSDCWGLICPGDKERAAHFSGLMASVTHDGNGIWGGRFVAACIAEAFIAKNVAQILDAGLSVIPQTSDYASMVCDVRAYCLNSDSWDNSFQYVKEKYGYHHYPGGCHIIPNAAVIVLCLVHGNGNYSRTINIGNMCGWDTDCNVGNLGAILGVYNGASGIEEKWLGQVNDFFCASSVLGYLNIQTVSQAADTAAYITHHLYKREPDKIYKKIFESPEGSYAHFNYPNATQAFRGREDRGNGVRFENTTRDAHFGNRSLKMIVPHVESGDCFSIYRKTYYQPKDFDDSRYDPDFSPTVYPGDYIQVWVKLDSAFVSKIHVVPYIKDRISGDIKELTCNNSKLTGQWQQIQFEIPQMKNIIIEETGLQFVCKENGERKIGEPVICYLDEWQVVSKSHFEMEFAALPLEHWNVFHELPAHLTYLRGIVRVEDSMLQISGSKRPAEAYTGNVNWTNYELSCCLTPKKGQWHSVLFRVQGAMRNYAVSLEADNRLVLKKRYEKDSILCEVPFAWEVDREYRITIEVNENCMKVLVDGREFIEYEDQERPILNGGIGFGNGGGSRTAYRCYQLREKR